MKSIHSFRVSAIAAALVIATPLIHATESGTKASPFAPPKMARVVKPEQSYNRFIITYRKGAAERSDHTALLQNVQVAIARAGFAKTVPASSDTAAAPLTASYQRKLAIGADLVKMSRRLNQQEASALMQQIASDPAVESVQPDRMLQAVRDIAAPAMYLKPNTSSVVGGIYLNAEPSGPNGLSSAADPSMPDDPYYTDYQWHFNNAIGGANVANAWSLADGKDVIVAVIDTGITEHPDLDMSLANDGYDFISDALVSGRDTDGRVSGGWDLGDWTNTEPYLSECGISPGNAEESSWHGTHVSGTIAELTNNGEGMAGIAHNAKVLPVRALGHCGGYASDIADAIVWASGGHVDGVPDNTHPAQVINMSLGGGGSCSVNDATGKAIADAMGRGVTVVVAAGNSNDNVANYTPASCPGVIAVASNGITGKRAFYSNYGSGVTLSAPGGGIYQNDDPSTGQTANPDGFVWSAINEGTTTPAGATYGGMAGTSQASPHVAGVVAMIVSAVKEAGIPALSPGEIKTVLTSSARAFPVNPDQPVGAGIVDANAAVISALNNGGDETAIPLTRNVPKSNIRGDSATSPLYSIEVPSGATTLNIRTMGGTGNVSLYLKEGSAPASDGNDAPLRSIKPGNNEVIVIARPQPTTYYIRLIGAPDFYAVSVLATYTL